ncbi:MAG: SpoIIIAH-like family protein [Acutalibacteraceae bacterium]
MKIKTRTKKILVLSVMVVLLVATGVLNWALNDRLIDNTPADANAVTETFFAAYRSDREATRESEFLYLDAIITSETSSAEAKKAAEEQKLGLVERMEKELQLETLIKSKGFEDAIVTMSESGVNVVVGAPEVTAEQAAQILDIVQTETTFKAADVKIIPYS